LREPYSLVEAREAGWLDVGDGHQVHFEDAGPVDGLPVVFLHGGPGSGCKPSHRQFFDPDRYRSVLFDQRGCGLSRPFASCEANTTRHLVEDIERLREHLGIPAWVVFAGSWGVALGLAYAERHPERVLGMVLRGSFLARERDLTWFLADGAGRMLPKAWAELNDALGQPSSLIDEIHRRVFGADDVLALAASRAWGRWSGEVVSFSMDTESSDPEPPADVLIGKTRLEMHYARHRYFLEPDELLANASRLPQVPVTIVHGQRDLTCTPAASWALHRALPHSRLEILRTAGHLSGEPLMTDALLRAADAMRRELRPDD
jgi:proline iminopeptidase